MGRTIELYGFPTSVTLADVKAFVEKFTGDGTVYAMKLRRGKGRVPRAFAIIQFTSADFAASMMSKASALRYGTSYLKAREVERDIVPKPRVILFSLEDVKLYFGCQVSKGSFSVLWKKLGVTVNFGTGMRKVHFLFSHNDVQYKLELSYENIWKIELHRPRAETARYLLIQLLGAPRVFMKDGPPSESLFENMFDSPLYNFFLDGPDDQWIRAIDFTPFCCIGQSTAICLEFPYGQKLPNFKENFAFYEESNKQYILQTGVPFSQNMGLVPIVASPQGIQIPYDILFKVNSLVQHGCLAGLALDGHFYHLVYGLPPAFIEHALEKIFYSKEFIYEPTKWLHAEYTRYLNLKKRPQSPAISLDTGLVYVRRLQVTPCKVYFFGPEINVSNRVIRHFHEHIDNFLRVSFVDEELDNLFSTDLSTRSQNKKTEIYTRILSILKNGIVIGDKKFEFLAFSSSQLRENSLWMFAPTRTGCTAAYIREWMGDFRKIRNVAKYAARLGQSFGSSTETLSVHRDEMEIIPDVKIRTYDGLEYVFSDGIGKISLEFAKRVAKKCGYDSTPSAFQIRYGGYKGVVAVDPDPTSCYKLSLRKSMQKYDSDITKLDVLARSKFQPCYLNRQLISLLSTLGIKDGVFEKKQKEAVDQLNNILTDSLKAQEVLDLMSAGEITNVLKEMLICGYKPNLEPFLSMMLQTFRASKLLELRQKSRIFIPNGRAMMGCLDETKTLEYGEVFIRFSKSRLQNLSDNSYHLPENYMVVGKVVVAKNPCLHPGDVRVLNAVDVPALYHMVDCVVFPQKGPRPHPNECSGSDLDGDIYFVCWDQELVPSRTVKPMDYTAAASIELDHDVMIEEVEEYFTNYIVNDSLGIIANAHTVFADKEPLKAMSEPCIKLAKLFSTAVDFPKTGIPAVIPPELYVKIYPDFMEKPDKPTYESHNVIGKLFREVLEVSTSVGSISSFSQRVARESYDPDMEVDGFMEYVDDAFYHKTNYDYKLGNLMDYYGIKTEAEILSGNIMKMSKSFNKKRDSEAINMAVRSLRKEARSWFNESSSIDSGSDDAYAKASAWYHVTYHPSYWGCYNEGMNRDHYLSFPWCVYPQLMQIKKEKIRMRRASSLGRRFSQGLHLI
ncbi:hypothetical protein Fmac_001799 [Flemingia macrophylla]|uniref:RNA-dependent RNA polymerase n=1 Tax=Flemingia macrophylla TaxID=520843 RepID=A0ABD1NI40_9FABA